MTARGRDGEADVIGDLLDKYPNGILSLVSDSYDIYNCTENIYGKMFKDKILARNGKLVVRPDSGNPLEVVVRLLDTLYSSFGGHINTKGYRVLNPKVGLLWGDGIDYDGINKILWEMRNNGYSAENIVFGMGGGLLQKINRDIQRFAFKSSAQRRNGAWFDIYKSPIEGGKVSKKGKLKLVRNIAKTSFETVPIDDPRKDELVEVFRDGQLLNQRTFAEVRNSAKH